MMWHKWYEFNTCFNKFNKWMNKYRFRMVYRMV
jgi:hypothetical protein